LGRVCLRLARHPNHLQTISSIIQQTQPDTLCYGALVNCFTIRQDYAAALKTIDQMQMHGLKPTLLTYRLLLDRLGRDDPSLQLEVFQAASTRVSFDTTMCNKWLHALLKAGRWQQALGLPLPHPDIVSYVTLISGLSDLDRPQEALEVTAKLLADPKVQANEVAFCALRQFCRTHGFERHWPPMRAWCVSHGVQTGLSANQPWREAVLDPVSMDPSRLAFPK
jgi:pentatricopeptide repeat protein